MRPSIAAAAVALPLLLASCSASDPSTVGGPEPSPSDGSVGPSISPSTAATSDVTTIEVTYAHGAVSPRGYTAKVKLGTKIHLVVHADVSDEIHVHTYDKKADLTGGVATIDFTASIPGLFEIELESRSYTLLHLQVG
jgi:hypothetical protein